MKNTLTFLILALLSLCPSGKTWAQGVHENEHFYCRGDTDALDDALPNDKPTLELREFIDEVVKPKKTLSDFKEKLDSTFTPDKAVMVFGKPDRNVGSGLIIYEYGLADGSMVRMGFPGFAKIIYAKHVKQDGTTDEIPLK